MPKKILCENQSGDFTSTAVALQSSQAEIVVAGTFTSVKFEDSKYGLPFQPVLNVADGTELELTEPTNELELISATNVGRKIQAVVVGGVDVTIYADEGVL